MNFGSIPFVARATPEAGPPPSGSIIETLMDASTWGFAIVPGDATITRCYTETTGASATTLCVNADEIGTIECVPTGQYITFPSGVKPTFHVSGGDTWINNQASGKIFYTAGSAYTGAGEVVMAMAGRRESTTVGGPVMLSANLNDGAWWEDSARGAVAQSGAGLYVGSGFDGGSISGFTFNTDNFVLTAVLGASGYDIDTLSSTEAGGGTGSWGTRNWNVNRAYFGATADENVWLDGRIYAAIIAAVDATAGQKTDLHTYLTGVAGL